ncbi:MAG TPA: hypothetical protein VNQ14_05150 [Woeseiaceae bacterium]|nr:hypothetical protein [Woeseiaceae bacterium]
MTKGYVDQIGAFQYKGHAIEAHVVRPGPTATADRRTTPIWTVTADGERFVAFPASPGDTEDEVRERLKRWADEHLR